MMFHRALPELVGSGVTTLTPGLIRSDQLWIPSGLPLRTTKTTTESVTKPLCALASQLEATCFAATSFAMSGSVENSATSAGWPAMIARLCEPEAPYDCLNVTPLPAEVAWKAGISLL
jgi:hypothetical protein